MNPFLKLFGVAAYLGVGTLLGMYYVYIYNHHINFCRRKSEFKGCWCEEWDGDFSPRSWTKFFAYSAFLTWPVGTFFLIVIRPMIMWVVVPFFTYVVTPVFVFLIVKPIAFIYKHYTRMEDQAEIAAGKDKQIYQSITAAIEERKKAEEASPANKRADIACAKADDLLKRAGNYDDIKED